MHGWPVQLLKCHVISLKNHLFFSFCVRQFRRSQKASWANWQWGYLLRRGWKGYSLLTLVIKRSNWESPMLDGIGICMGGIFKSSISLGFYVINYWIFHPKPSILGSPHIVGNQKRGAQLRPWERTLPKMFGPKWGSQLHLRPEVAICGYFRICWLIQISFSRSMIHQQTCLIFLCCSFSD